MNPFLIPDKWYDFLKKIALIGLPAIGTAYATIAEIWGMGATTKVLATIVVIETFLGSMLGISTRIYNNSDEKYDGVVHTSIEEATGVKLYSLELNEDPETIDTKPSIVLKVDVS